MVGQSSPVMLQSLSNFGTDNLNLTSAFSTSDSHFTIDSNSTTCGTTIIAGSTCTVGVIFTPTANGPVTASITLVSNSYNSPQPLQLTGTGQLVSPLQFTLPAQTEVYGQPFPEIVQVTNGNPAPTGTITFSIGKQVLCTLTTTLGPTTTCNAPNSGLSVGTYTVTFSYTGDSNYCRGEQHRHPDRHPGAAHCHRQQRLPRVRSGQPDLHRHTHRRTPRRHGSGLLLHDCDRHQPCWQLPHRRDPHCGRRHQSRELRHHQHAWNPHASPQAPLTITVIDASRQYGQPNPHFHRHHRQSGAAERRHFYHYLLHYRHCHLAGRNLSDQRDRLRPVCRELPRHRNSGTLTVTPAPLTVTVGNATRPYGAANPAFTSTVSGALNGDTFTNTYSTTATVTSPVGNYPINDAVGGPAASNYTIHGHSRNPHHHTQQRSL